MINRPNFIYIICHDLGRYVGAYGAGFTTPHLDRFASRAIILERAFCTSPCCSPSRGCAMTGQYAHTNGLMGIVGRGWQLPLNQLTVVDHFNSAGYQTVHFGYQHERRDPRDNRYQVEEPSKFVETAFSGAREWLEARDQSDDKTPFYLNIGTLEVHPTVWQSRTENVEDRRLAVYRPRPAGESAYLPPIWPDSEAHRLEAAHFQACVEYFDRQFGELLESIDRLRLKEETVIVFTTDHGLSGSRGKGTLYDAGLEIACFIEVPGSPLNGSRVAHLIPNLDFAPTLLEAAGIPLPATMQGASFWPLLTGEKYTPHTRLFQERNYHGPNNYDPMRAIRTESWHYIRNFAEDPLWDWTVPEVHNTHDTYERWIDELWPQREKPRPEEELYQLSEDPREERNLSSDPQHAAVLAEFRQQLHAWMSETSDPLLHGLIPPPS